MPEPTSVFATEPHNRMNKTEARYADRLELLRLAGDIRRYDFEPVSLRLAGNTFYTPDFRVIMADGSIEFHEVKGSWQAKGQQAARVRFKVANEQHPYRFVAVTEPKKGQWEYEVLK